MEKINITKEEGKMLIEQMETQIYTFKAMIKTYINPTEAMISNWTESIRKFENMIRILKEDL